MLPNSILLAALTATASASVTLVEVVHIVDTLEINGAATALGLLKGSSANSNYPRAVFAKRATRQECASSAASWVATMPTPAPEVRDYLETVAVTDSCSLVAPLSLSSGIVSYLTAVADWMFEDASLIQAIATKCDVEPVELEACETGATYYFTEANATVSVPATDIMADYVPPSPRALTDAEKNGASAASVSLSALAVVGVLAVAISL